MSIFLTPLPGQFAPFRNIKKALDTSSEALILYKAYMAQCHAMFNIDPASGLMLSAYRHQVIQGPFVYDNSIVATQYQQWTL